MTTTINKVDDFLEAFPNKIIKHTGRPDYEVLNNIKTAFKRNFATIPCTLGGGAHGYLGAVLTPAEYAAATPLNMPSFMQHQPSQVLQQSFHPTAPVPKSLPLNVNSTRRCDNGRNTKISRTQEKSSFKMESMTCI